MPMDLTKYNYLCVAIWYTGIRELKSTMEPLESHQIWDASISGLILFITFLCDMLFMINNADIASYVNDNST